MNGDPELFWALLGMVGRGIRLYDLRLGGGGIHTPPELIAEVRRGFMHCALRSCEATWNPRLPKRTN